MKITSIQLKNFKRFTDLHIDQIPETAKLVLIVGPNGCGKSSLFDALFHWYRSNTGLGINSDESYYRKSSSDSFGWRNQINVTLANGEEPKKGCLYVRTAYRNDPDFKISNIGQLDPPTEVVKYLRFIDNDQTVSENYQRLIHDTIAAVYDQNNDKKNVAVMREELIGSIRTSMKKVFGNLILNNISDPLGAGAFFFEKGTTSAFHYKNLSGGEKAAFDLLLDIHIKKKFFNDTIFCIDELETHLHTKVQGILVKELYNILPDNSQLWLTTHSLGVLRAAQELSVADPSSVCIIDFDMVDPDIPRKLVPSSLGRITWEKMLSIALDDLSLQISPKVIIVCEGSSVGNKRKNFDALIYSQIFKNNNSDIVFVSGGSSNQLATTGVLVSEILERINPESKIISLRDRDDLSKEEIEEFEKDGNLVLGLRNLESYLLADDVIEALLKRENKESFLADALKIKENAIENSIRRNKPSDDLKSASGEIYTGLKNLLCLKQCGNNPDSFMRDTLAPLITDSMPIFKQLKEEVLDRI